MGKKRSPVWNHFEKQQNGFARCLACATDNTLLKLMPKGITANLLIHLRKQHNLEMKNKNSVRDNKPLLRQRIPREPVNSLGWVEPEAPQNHNGMVNADVVNQLREPVQPENQQIEAEPQDDDIQIIGPNRQDESLNLHDLADEAAPSSYCSLRASPTLSMSSRSMSPLEDERNFDCENKYSLLGKLVTEELQEAANVDPQLALKYEIVILELLTNMNREMLSSNSFPLS